LLYVANDLQEMTQVQTTRQSVDRAVAHSGVRRTVPRQQVLDVFTRQSQPLTAAEVHQRLRDRRINLASVYRAIHLFCRLGVLSAAEHVEGGQRFELSDRHRAHHHHLICESCGRIEDFEGCFLAGLERKILQHASFRVRRHELQFYGVCGRCQA
jgi:Fur family ferric uptake transcriptional regulator